jgi:hypothetical protein
MLAAFAIAVPSPERPDAPPNPVGLSRSWLDPVNIRLL